jgi:hypothetical protein
VSGWPRKRYDDRKKVLEFPKPPEEPGARTIVCQIGDERFAIHYEIEDLPAAAPLIPWKPGTRKGAEKIVK